MGNSRLTLALGVGKLINFLAKIKSGGTAAPGLLALKIDPCLVKKLAKNLSFSILVSGTNGKTTTTRMIASILKFAKLKFIHNRTGSNLLRGIASKLINKSGLNNKFANCIGLWEVDEAVLPEAIANLKPKIVVITNLFRDQLDRYGEIDTLAKKWQTCLQKLPKDCLIILNGDDPSLGAIGKELKTKVLYFGIKDKSLGDNILTHASDATLCPKCLLPLSYERCFVSHLGIYCCPKCGSIQPNINVFCLKAQYFSKQTCAKITLVYKAISYTLNLKIPGIYNIYNALASFTVCQALTISPLKISEGLEKFKPAFGRFEKIIIKDKTLQILLVKNPTGFNEIIKILVAITKGKEVALLLVLNDLIADGRDVSWIWDADLEQLRKINFHQLLVSGLRAQDLLLRLKYGDVVTKNTNYILEQNLNKAVSTLINQRNNNLFIISTYTAMLEVRKILKQKNLVKNSWND